MANIPNAPASYFFPLQQFLSNTCYKLVARTVHTDTLVLCPILSRRFLFNVLRLSYAQLSVLWKDGYMCFRLDLGNGPSQNPPSPVLKIAVCNSLKLQTQTLYSSHFFFHSGFGCFFRGEEIKIVKRGC